MRKLYTLLAALIFSAASFAQIGPSWWQMLPEDYDTNPPDRDTVMIQKVPNDYVDNAASLAAIWDAGVSEIIPIDNNTNGECNTSGDADYKGDAMIFFDDTNIYVLFNANDEDLVANDKAEIHLAPYESQYDYDGELVAPNDPMTFGGREIPSATYVDMALYGSWTSAGAYKTEYALETAEDIYPGSPVYSLIDGGENADTLGDVSMGNTHEPVNTLFAAKTGGYHFLIIYPVAMFNGTVPDPTDLPGMSIAVKLNDSDSDDADCDDPPDDKADRAEFWGATTGDHNNAYWAIGYYGGYGQFNFTVLSNRAPMDNSRVNAYYHNGFLKLQGAEFVKNLDVYSVTGARMLSASHPGSNVSLAHLSKGVYLVKITEENGNVTTLKIAR